MNQNLVARNRIQSIDFLRGLVMVIMALDHVRDFFHNQAMIDDPTNMATTTPMLFFTRWITHFCAPTFVFLAGTSAFLMGQKRSKKEMSIFLIKRGFWLILVEVLIITLAFTFNPLYNLIILQVIWAIGVSMVILGLLVWLPLWAIFSIGIIIVFGHNLLDTAEAARNGQVGGLWQVLHTPQSHYLLQPDKTHFIFVFYAFPPWTGIMLLGYCFGKFFTREYDPVRRQKILLFIGLGAIALFIILRGMNVYGDREPWHEQRSAIFTLLSFLNTTKYPPSLLFTLMTLGPSILFLALIEPLQNKLGSFFITYGRVPFFYYVLHFYLIHFICVIVFFASGYDTSQIVSQQSPFFFRPPTFGFHLWVVYLIWIMVVLLLYPLCKWYNQYKATHRHWWLSYT